MTARCRRSPTTFGPSSSTASGQVVKIYNGNDWKPEELLATLRAADALLSALAFSRRELRLIDRLRTPPQVQRYLNALALQHRAAARPRDAAKLPRRRRHHTAHCLEAALAAAVILEQHGYPPLVLSFESIDNLDHVLFVYRRARTLGLGRPLTRSRAARPQAGLPHRARSRAELRRPVHRLQRPHHRLCRRRSGRAGRLRLATVRAERLEGRAVAAELPAPPIRSSNERINRLRRWYRHYRETLRKQARL